MTSSPVREGTALRLDRVLAQEQVDARVPSVVAGVVRDGELCWTGVRGEVGRLGAGAPTADQTQYRIGSITKAMTAVLVLQLRDAERLSLDDRLGDHLPDVAYAEHTLRDLLSHAGGLPAEPPGSWWERSPGVAFDELARRIDAGEQVLPRGQRFHYSNLAFGLLGRVIEVVNGRSWRTTLEERLLGPLGMGRTTYAPGPTAAQGYSVGAWSGTLTEEPHQDTAAMAPAGQLWSTVPDLARFAAFLADPDPAVLSPESVAEMCVPRSGTPDGGATVTYGLGARLMRTPDGRMLVGHTGSMPGFLAGLFVDRDRRVAAVYLANGSSGLRTEGLAVDLLHTLDTEEPALPDAWRPTLEIAKPVEEILGIWHWGETALVARLVDGVVSLAPPDGDAAWRYRPTGVDEFIGISGYHTGETLRAVRRPDGSVSHLECATFVFTRVPYDPSAPIPGGSPRA